MAESGRPRCFRLAPATALRLESRDSGVLLHPRGEVELNRSAAVILALCDGRHSEAEIVRRVARHFDGNGLADDVHEFLQAACGHGWLVEA